jgi:hypothetical protein
LEKPQPSIIEFVNDETHNFMTLGCQHDTPDNAVRGRRWAHVLDQFTLNKPF